MSKKLLIGTLKWMLGFYLVILLLLYLFQDKVIFQATPLPHDFKFSFDQKFEEKTFKSPDGIALNTLFFPTNGKSKGLVFYCHGNKRNLETWGRFANHFTKNGYDVFMWDYRGFGKSGGKPSELNIFQDSEHLYNIMGEKYPENQIVIYGRSLGSGVATRLASLNNSKMLILETPYLHMADVGNKHFPFLPYSFLINHPFRTDRYIKKVKCPIHIFHGTNDELVPYQSSLDLAKILGQEPSVLITTIEGGTHRNLGRFDKYQQNLAKILED